MSHEYCIHVAPSPVVLGAIAKALSATYDDVQMSADGSRLYVFDSQSHWEMVGLSAVNDGYFMNCHMGPERRRTLAAVGDALAAVGAPWHIDDASSQVLSMNAPGAGQVRVPGTHEAPHAHVLKYQGE
jgi:hypothetical protein